MRSNAFLPVVACLLLSTTLFAQEHPPMSEEQRKMMEAYQKAGTPGDPHRALEHFVGTWDTVIRFWPAPGAPPEKSAGTSESRWILGGRYLEQRFEGTAMGMPFEGRGYTGFDNIRNRYFGTWMDSMSTGMMTTTGVAEEGGKVWKFTGTMDDPLSGKAQPVEEVVRLEGPDKHVMEMWSPGPDGKMFKSMEIVYTRKK